MSFRTCQVASSSHISELTSEPARRARFHSDELHRRDAEIEPERRRPPFVNALRLTKPPDGKMHAPTSSTTHRKRAQRDCNCPATSALTALASSCQCLWQAKRGRSHEPICCATRNHHRRQRKRRAAGLSVIAQRGLRLSRNAGRNESVAVALPSDWGSNRWNHDIDRVRRVDQRRVPIDQSAVGPIASPRLSRRHIGGLTPSAPITTAAASGPSFFITTKTLRPTAS